MIKSRYKEGYRNDPESIDEIKAFERLAGDAIKKEGLEYVSQSKKSKSEG